MKGDNWAEEGEDRVIHCECGHEKVRQIKVHVYVFETVFISRDARYFPCFYCETQMILFCKALLWFTTLRLQALLPASPQEVVRG